MARARACAIRKETAAALTNVPDARTEPLADAPTEEAGVVVPPRTWLRGLFHSRLALFVGFAFAVMADPVSSVAYAIEAALRALGGNLALLGVTMVVVVGIIGVVVVNYQQIVARYPHGGGAATAAHEAFGPAWTFLPLGALIVDFVLTISISVAAASSALIAYVPAVAPARVPIALVLLVLVAGLSWFGHGGRVVFATMTIAFLSVTTVLVASAWTAPAPVVAATASAPVDVGSALTILIAFPVAMALATGVEAPSSAIAQLGQLDDDGRRQFGRWTLWFTLFIVGGVTLALAGAAARLDVGIPPADSTQLAELARTAAPGLVFGLFQLTSAVLLLAAASSSFQAGPGLLKALAGSGSGSTSAASVLPAALGRTNQHHTPFRGVIVFLAAAAAVVVAAGAQDQSLVLFYAVSVFISFVVGLVSMARIDGREGRRGRQASNIIGLTLVAFTLLANLARGLPIVSLAASLALSAVLYRMWVRAGRPQGIDIAD